MKMPSENFAMGIFLFFQITMGILGNSSILFYYIILMFTGKHLMPKDLIIEHLTIANYLTIILRGIPRTMSYFGFKIFLDDIGCKLIVYISRMTRGMSLYAICILSCFQAVTIRSSNSRWTKLKYRATNCIGPSCSVSWLFHLLLNILIAARVSGPTDKENVTNSLSYAYCSLFTYDNVRTVLYIFLLCFSDVLGLCLMACSSVSMVSILYRHKHLVKNIHSAQHFLKASPEDRATQIILILLCIFVISYSFPYFVALIRAFSKYPVPWALNIFILIEICFPVVCPFVLINNMKSNVNLFLLCFGKR